MIKFLTGSAALLALFSSTLLAAASLEELHSLPALHDARIQDEQQADAVEKIYPLGAVSRISGNLRFADEVRVNGRHQRISWQLAVTHDAASAFTQARSLLQQQARPVYWCEGRDCGPSNLWANAVFGNARLYGPDDRQAYALLQDKNGQHLYVLYAITRGNGRSMLHAEFFDAGQSLALTPVAATLLLQLRHDGKLLFPDVGSSSDWTRQLALALNRDATLRLALGGEAAEAWRQALIEAGVRAARLELDADDSNEPAYIRSLR